MNITALKNKVAELLQKKDLAKESAILIFQEVVKALESGALRVAEKHWDQWSVNSWVKEVILLGFKFGNLVEFPGDQTNYFDKDTLPVRQFTLNDQVRLVPGGSAVRAGAYVAPGTIIMPPAYINIGTYIDTGCLIDSHALVGSCAQIGKNVHLSAAAQIGGVLEPVGAMPVIIEDEVFIGGNCGIYEGTIIKAGAVIGSGVILNSSIAVYDSINDNLIKKTTTEPLTIPNNAVVVPGSRPITSGAGKNHNMQLYCPIIIKYKDAKTKAAVALEELLR